MEDDHRGGRARARIGAIGRTAQPEEQRGRRGEESRKQRSRKGRMEKSPRYNPEPMPPFRTTAFELVQLSAL